MRKGRHIRNDGRPRCRRLLFLVSSRIILARSTRLGMKALLCRVDRWSDVLLEMQLEEIVDLTFM